MTKPTDRSISLAFDIGNTRTKVALVTEGVIARVDSVPRDAAALRGALAVLLGGAVPASVGIVSVVPAQTEVVRAAVQAWCAEPFVVAHDAPLPFRMAYETPETLGTDRLAAAAAAWARLSRSDSGEPRPVVAIDAGTALTFEVVAPDAAFLGGVIAPGRSMLARSLSEGTAQLPHVLAEAAPPPIGASTHAAIAAGVDGGYVGMVLELLRRIESDLGARPALALTGGDAPHLLAPLAEYAPLHAPNLVLEGVVALQALVDAN